ncbi:GNAT family N-acetyltransferase [Bacillus sp. DX1.1]|uniref:GNAT family N-acetyltransferase n=1 Tax=unclassified Bacillus (in: firmicutes) TaxID=185979 RepID=UPI00256FDF33|nr:MULTISPECIES: GNAT family N-acetyltransferase [unclassified Bacillus (in: firmicutes)]MDM5155910.1 GNAT family N-acetyltransferase [Bacillus sp. DX1.1]WJE80204.1 GNAT family N-acetyltransferase [Bacillus sp. DX3.1]
MIRNVLVRRFNKNDLDQVLQLFYDTVHTINAKDYNQKQLDAWAPKGLDRTKWLNSLEKNICYVAEFEGKIISFGDYNDEAYIDRLFTHKNYQGWGVASQILQMLEKEATQLEQQEIYTEASITARPFFEKKGYMCIEEQNKKHNGQIFINYIMKKTAFS